MQYLKSVYNYFSSQKSVNFYDSLQDLIVSKKQFCTDILKSVNDLSNCLNDFQIRITNLTSNLENIEYTKEEYNIYNLIKSIHKGILAKFKENINALNDLNTHFVKYIGILTEEMHIYKEYKDIYIKLNEEKTKLKDNEIKYHNTGVEKEGKIIKLVELKIQQLEKIEQSEELMNELEQSIYPTTFARQIYEKSIKDVNNLIDVYNERHCKYFNYLPELLAKDDVFYYNLINTYVILLKSENKKINDEIKKLENAENLEKKENKSEMKKLIEQYDKNKKEEKKKKFVQYPTKILFSDCKNKKQFEVYFKSVNIIKKYIDENIFPEYDYKTELNNFKMSELLQKLFANKNKEINKVLKDTFDDLIENPSVHHTVFVILSKLRTNGTFCQSKALISLLGEGFEKVLINSKKNKLYDNIKNIIILSQTYYYEDDKKEKKYIFEFIKNNKWLKSAKFWRNFITYMINNDLKRCELTKEKDNYQLGEVVFSNLLTFASNMKSFEIDKRVIIKIMDELFVKYNYVSESNKQVIYQMIVQGNESGINFEEELIKLRKEYDPSLENVKDDDKNKIDKINDKEAKEDKKDENINEDKKDENINEDKKDNNINEDKKDENINEDKKDENINEDKIDKNINGDKIDKNMNEDKIDKNMNEDKKDKNINEENK